MLTAPFVSLVLALASVVSGAHAYDIEPRTAAAGRAALGRVAQASRGAALRGASRAPPPRIRPSHQPAPGGSSNTVKAAKAGGLSFLGAKLAGGGTVGLGSLIAQGVDTKLNPDKRDLEARNGALRIGRVGAAGFKSAVRNAAPKVKPIAPPRAPAPKFGKTRVAGAFTATALTAGIGEYYGGNAMGNAIDRLNAADGKKRELYEELLSRSPQTGAIGRVAGTALRAGRGGVRAAKSAAPHRPAPPPARSGVVRKVGTAGAIGAAAASGGFLEGMVQNITPEAQERIRKNPKDAISKMLPPNPFGGKKREYVEDLMARGSLGVSFFRSPGSTEIKRPLSFRNRSKDSWRALL
ncbi:hypothetical protein DXG03_000654 [Asterophora parasitica]|uniref:Uncharacterized protein n=1 Tax=Asterophora parasitica TaxID=117018 RepID=A0A9P7KC68_9AGAR|nr:hypothetical protein DXG03_000654 [Asterophora parasitica]